MEDKPRPSSSCLFPSPDSGKFAWMTSGPFQELLEMVLSPGTTSCLRTEDAAFSHCLIPVIMFALASFSPSSSVHAVLFSTLLPLGISICYLSPFLSRDGHVLANGKIRSSILCIGSSLSSDIFLLPKESCETKNQVRDLN